MKETAGPSTALRSGRDDKFVWLSATPYPNRFVIPPVPACRGTGAQRSGGTCGFFHPSISYWVLLDAGSAENQFCIGGGGGNFTWSAFLK